MLRSWAWAALGALLLACGQVRDLPDEPAPGSGGAGSAAGGDTGLGGGVHSGGRSNTGGTPLAGGSTGGLLPLFTGGAKGVEPRPGERDPGWIYDVDGGHDCSLLPGEGRRAFECLPQPEGRRDGCSEYVNDIAPQVVIRTTYAVGCRVALPELDADGCGPRICTCQRGTPSPEVPYRYFEWVCPPRE